MTQGQERAAGRVTSRGMLSILLAAWALAAEPTLQQRFITEVARRSLAGLRTDLDGPCLTPAEAGRRTIDWGPYGENTKKVMTEVALAMGITPTAMAGWPALPVDVSIPEVDELDKVPWEYAARCFPAPPALPPPTASPSWEADVDSAVVHAGSRRVLVRVHAKWCAADTQMDSEAWSDPAALAVIQRCFVPVAIDVTEKTEAEDAIVKRLGVSGIPAWVVVDSSSSPVAPPAFGCQSAATVISDLTALCPP